MRPPAGLTRCVVAALVCAPSLVFIGRSSLLAQSALAVPVFDASNYAEALVEAFDLLEEVEHMFFEALPLPVNMAVRYQVESSLWTLNALLSAFPAAQPVVRALNAGDPTGAAYQQVVDPLADPSAALTQMPAALQRRFADDYATIQLADTASALGIDQSGEIRTSGNGLLQALQAMQADADSPDSAFQTETGLLQKINAASVLGLRESEQTNQFLSAALETLLVDGKRQRDAEAKLMNARITQWRYGATYGQDLFSRTASDLDSWRLQ